MAGKAGMFKRCPICGKIVKPTRKRKYWCTNCRMEVEPK